MNKDQEKEYTEQLKVSAKELIDGISGDTRLERKVLELIYGFIRSGFLECKAQKGIRYELQEIDHPNDTDHEERGLLA